MWPDICPARKTRASKVLSLGCSLHALWDETGQDILGKVVNLQNRDITQQGYLCLLPMLMTATSGGLQVLVHLSVSVVLRCLISASRSHQ